MSLAAPGSRIIVDNVFLHPMMIGLDLVALAGVLGLLILFWPRLRIPQLQWPFIGVLLVGAALVVSGFLL